MRDNKIMKGWFVWCGDEWGDFVHGKTASEAKTMMWKEWCDEIDEWIFMRPTRFPKFDNVPITQKIIDRHYATEDYKWMPICTCPLCRGEG